MNETPPRVSNVCLMGNCNSCNGKLVAHGSSRAGKKRFRCSHCRKTRIIHYSYNAYRANTDSNIVLLTKEGVGIRGTARILKISANTVLKRIMAVAKRITRPCIAKGKKYQVDELCTFLGRKRNFIWIVLALDSNSKKIVSFAVGKRTNKTISRVLDTLLASQAATIATDRLKNYRYLVQDGIHSVKRFGTNHVERYNLTLRTRLKRLSRRTICFSRSLVVLNAILTIYFWG